MRNADCGVTNDQFKWTEGRREWVAKWEKKGMQLGRKGKGEGEDMGAKPRNRNRKVTRQTELTFTFIAERP